MMDDHKNALNRSPSACYKRDPLFDNTRWVMVVEDDLDLQPFISSVLKEIDPYTKITWETSARSAVEKIDENSALFDCPLYELMIVDIFLQGAQTGIELWEKLRKYENEMSFIFITGANKNAVINLIGHHENVPLILQKPIDYQFLKQTIEFYYQDQCNQH